MEEASEFRQKEHNLHFRRKRFHAKSKGGCLQCKEYRTKCDENKPSCSRCTKKSLKCDYSKPPSKPARIPSTRSRSAQSPASSTSVEQHALHDQDLSTPPALDASPLLSVADMSLLHYYHTHINDIYDNPSLAALARTVVVEVAFEHPFFLHSLLAAAGLLKAYRVSADKVARDSLLSQSTTHQALSVSRFRSAISHITPENCGAIFMYTVFTAISIYTSFNPRLHDDTIERSPQLIDSNWWRILRGTSRVLAGREGQEWAWFKESALYPFTYDGCWQTPSAPKDPVFQRLRERFLQLESLWIDSAASPTDADDSTCTTPPHSTWTQTMPTTDAAAYAKSFSDLLAALSRVAAAFSPSATASTLAAHPACFAWLHHVPETFLDCMDRKTPQSLIILAYYAVLCSRVKVWYTEGLGVSMLRAVWWEFERREGEGERDVLEVGGKGRRGWRAWLAWPVRMVGLDVGGGGCVGVRESAKDTARTGNGIGTEYARNTLGSEAV